jgi:hypothetical protein
MAERKIMPEQQVRELMTKTVPTLKRWTQK